jgi:putative transposase
MVLLSACRTNVKTSALQIKLPPYAAIGHRVFRLLGVLEHQFGQDHFPRVAAEQVMIVLVPSRPRVSNDNPFSEALFRTCKYTPNWPTRGFATIEAARTWVQGFASWYNLVHRHSALRFVTPDERHRGEDRVLLANRHQVYELARAARPERWSGKTRNWQPIGPVWLNPERPDAGRAGHGSADALTQEAGGGGPMAGLAKRAA